MGRPAAGFRARKCPAPRAHQGNRRAFVGAAQPANAHVPGVDRQFAGFYRERYLLAEADPAVEKELHAALNENPARVIPVLGNIR